MASDGRDERYERGLDDYHDPTAGFGGAPPARSALTLRLLLAIFGFALAAVVTVLAGLEGITWLMIVATIFAVGAGTNAVWVAHRKYRGEPG